jgi:DNA-binding XRE family transcriptional regulator
MVSLNISGINMPIMLVLSDNRHYYTDMSELSFRSISELQVLLGEQVQALRFSRNLDQITTAEKAGISEKALRNLEAGRGSTVASFLRVLKALDSLDGLELLAPRPSVSPLALLRSSKARQRVRQSSASRDRNP